MKITTRLVLNFLYLLAWIIFVGLCIEAGAFIVNAVFVLVNPAIVQHLWQQVDLSDLFKYDKGYYFVITFMLSVIAIMKAWMFYLIIAILHNKKLSLAQPFNEDVKHFISNVSALALLIGIFSEFAAAYVNWLSNKNVNMPQLENMHLCGADVWLFMSVILFVITQIFKRGIEIQTENELTV